MLFFAVHSSTGTFLFFPVDCWYP